MKNGFAKLIVGVAATLCMAAPGYSSAILSFSGTPNDLGTVTTDPATEQVTALSAVPYTQLYYNGTAYSLDLTTLSMSGSTLTLSGEVFNAADTAALTGLGTSHTLLTILLQSPLTNIGNSSQLNIGSPTAISVTVNAQLLTDLAIPTSGTGSLLGLGVIGTGSNFSYSVDSDTLTVQQNTSATPEPGTFLICLSGLAVLLFRSAGGARNLFGNLPARKLLLGVAAMGLVMSVPSWAATAPALTLSDGTNSVTIDSTGKVIPAGSISTTASSVSAGKITWSGQIGNFTVTGATGSSKPAVGSAATNPKIDINSGQIITAGKGGGTLTISWSDVGFSGLGPMTLSDTTTLVGSGSANYTVYADTTNSLFGKGTLIATTGCTMSCNAVITKPGPAAQPYSMTSVDVIILASNSIFISDMLFNGTPVPLTLSCAATGTSGQVGIPFSSPAPTVSGGVAPYTFSVATGALPGGLTLNPATGAVTGTPVAIGSFSLKVTDSANNVSASNCSYTINSCPLSNLGAAAGFGILGLHGAQVNVQSSTSATVGVGASARLHLQGGALLNGPVFEDSAATVQIDGGASHTGSTTIESFAAIQSAALAASAAFGALTPTQTFNQQINKATTITGNGGRNVISIANQINLNNSGNLTISGGSSDNFVFNIAQGQNVQLQNGSSIILKGVSAGQVVFNFLGNGANLQIQSGNQGTSNTAGIFLNLLGQIQIQGGTHNSEFISGNQIQLQGNNGNIQVIAPSCATSAAPTVSSCMAASPVGILAQPAGVTAYVANGVWDNGLYMNTGVQVVQIEPTAGSPATINTPSPVNSCATNSVTGQTVCTANHSASSALADVYLISGTTLQTTLQSGATPQSSNYSGYAYSGGFCQNCGVVIDNSTNQAVIQMGLTSTASGTGLQFLNLATNAFSNPVPARYQISESILWDSGRNLILSPGEAGFYDLFQTSSPSTPEFQNPTPALPTGFQAKFDSAAEDCTTGIALGTDEDTNMLYITDLSQATFSPGSPIGTWTAPSMFKTIPEFLPYSGERSTEEGISGIAIAQGPQHLGIITGEFPEPTSTQSANAIIAIQLPSTSGVGTPDLTDYVVANLPPAPGDTVFSMGCDPHGVTAYVSSITGKAMGVVADYQPTLCTGVTNTGSPGKFIGHPSQLVLIDLQALLNAPRVPGTHTAAIPLPGNIVTFVPLEPQ